MDRNQRISVNSSHNSKSLSHTISRSNSTSSYHNRSKDSFTAYTSKTLKDFSILGITCINCQAIVLESDIEFHSIGCTTLSNSLILAEQTPVSELHFKLQKLSSFFVMLLSCKMKNHEREALDMLKRTVTMLLHMREESHIKYIQEIEQSVTLFTRDLEDSLGFHIYTQRVISLAQELITTIKLETKKRQVETLKKQVEKYRKKASSLQKVLAKGSLSQSVDFTSSRYSTDSGNSSGKDFRSLSTDQNVMLQYESSNEYMKKYFFSLALATKMNYHPNHNIHKLDLHKAYERILALNEDIENWPELIEKDLIRFAGKVIGKRKVRGSQPRSGRFYQIDTILEEEEPSSALSKDNSPLVKQCK